MIVWILAHSHGSHRLHVVRGDGEDGEADRLCLTLPKGISWLEERLRSCGIECKWPSALGGKKPQPAWTVHGLALLQPEVVWKSCATFLSPEAKVLHEYYKRPCDCVTLRVIQFAQFPEAFDIPADWPMRGSSLYKPRPIIKMGFCEPGELSELLAVCGGRTSCVQDIVQRWQSQVGGADHVDHVDVDNLLHFPIAEPIASLLLQGQWKMLLGLGRWKSPFVCGLPVNLKDQMLAAGHDRFDNLATEDPDGASGIADQLREWAPTLVQHALDAEGAEAEELKVHGVHSVVGRTGIRIEALIESIEQAGLPLLSHPTCQHAAALPVGQGYQEASRSLGAVVPDRLPFAWTLHVGSLQPTRSMCSRGCHDK